MANWEEAALTSAPKKQALQVTDLQAIILVP